jgi:hypothetical protein
MLFFEKIVKFTESFPVDAVKRSNLRFRMALLSKPQCTFLSRIMYQDTPLSIKYTSTTSKGRFYVSVVYENRIHTFAPSISNTL